MSVCVWRGEGRGDNQHHVAVYHQPAGLKQQLFAWYGSLCLQGRMPGPVLLIPALRAASTTSGVADQHIV